MTNDKFVKVIALLILIIVASMLIYVISYGMDLASNPCEVCEKKVLGMTCSYFSPAALKPIITNNPEAKIPYTFV